MVWLEVRILSGPPRSRLLPEISSRCTKGPELTGICATVRSQRRHHYSRQVIAAHSSLAPKSSFPKRRPREAEIRFECRLRDRLPLAASHGGSLELPTERTTLLLFDSARRPAWLPAP